MGPAPSGIRGLEGPFSGSRVLACLRPLRQLWLAGLAAVSGPGVGPAGGSSLESFVVRFRTLSLQYASPGRLVFLCTNQYLKNKTLCLTGPELISLADS